MAVSTLVFGLAFIVKNVTADDPAEAETMTFHWLIGFIL